MATPAFELEPALPCGTIVDQQFRIEHVIGRGGMSVVYRAHDLRLARDVALKLGTATSASALVRIEHEALALATLSHPNVVTVYQVGRFDGRLYIAMEFVTGGNAREWIAARRHSWHEIVTLYAAAADGLAAAHAAGFVHRDFKPDNVLVGTDGRPRVADFGLVRGTLTAVLAPARFDRVTSTGTVLGTPAYMAPEQRAGEPVDARADQFALCASIWEALFGSRPFDGIKPMESRLEVNPPGRSHVPRWLVAALRRGLSRDRDERWPSLAPLIAVLRRDPLARRRRAIALAGIAVAIGAAGFALREARATKASDTGCTTPPGDDIYVDAAAPPRGTGASGCAVRTITAALAIDRVHRVVHVAPGRYDRDLGERFPLVVRGDTAIVGAGREVTRIVGSGTYDHRAAGGVFDGQVIATMLVGDDRANVAISHLSIEAETTTPEIDREGLVCDRGNLASFDAPTTNANTRLTDIAVGPGYDTAVVVGNSAHSGCNLAMTRSAMSGSYIGVWVLGCGTGHDPGPVRAVIGGDSDAEGNQFRGMHSPKYGGVGVRVWDCTREMMLSHDRIIDTDVGVTVVEHAPAHGRFVIDHDQFLQMARAGLVVARAAVIERLDDNLFGWSNAPARSPAERALALVLDGETEAPPSFPRILHARNNTFVANDVAVEIRGAKLAVGGTTPIIDFGRPDDPGHNEFECNATEHGAAAPGFDIEVTAPSDGTGTLALAGNEWDHAPPMVGDGSVNGTDLALPRGRAPKLDLSDAISHPGACGRDSGPARR